MNVKNMNQTEKMEEFGLWFLNEEGLYLDALNCTSAKQLYKMYKGTNVGGIRATYERCKYAFECVHDL